MSALVVMAAFLMQSLSTNEEEVRARLLRPAAPYQPITVTAYDGDTIRLDGVSVRISNLDTPERGARAECDAERLLAAVATDYAHELIEDPTLFATPEGRADVYGRPLVRVSVRGRDWADFMVEKNLAVYWSGRRHDWCATDKG